MSSISRVSTDQKLIEMWLHGRPISTQKEYRRDVQIFFGFVGKNLSDCNLEDLQSYSNHLDEKGIKSSTKRRKLNAVKSLYSFATKLNYVRFNVAAALKIPKASNSLAGRILKKKEVLKLISKRQDESLRDYCFLRLLYATGMRISEICSLKWSDFEERDTGETQVTILGKGDKMRTVLVPAAVWVELEELRGNVAEDNPVFVSVRGKRLERTAGHRIVKAAVAAAGVKPEVSAHWLRHAHAQHAYAGGARIDLLRDSLGHSNISVTNVYLESNPEDSSSNYLGL
ncbi:Integrase [Nostoc sp. DSM 114161]|jgi:integrase/recombinase XerD|uniref:tyrosine-type recombinase/integrase n=1 Tax=Nostoc sp. DSM 114161 TaxID=3440143 RepID=UPI004045D141